jgi:hypothetical protein
VGDGGGELAALELRAKSLSKEDTAVLRGVLEELDGQCAHSTAATLRCSRTASRTWVPQMREDVAGGLVRKKRPRSGRDEIQLFYSILSTYKLFELLVTSKQQPSIPATPCGRLPCPCTYLSVFLIHLWPAPERPQL